MKKVLKSVKNAIDRNLFPNSLLNKISTKDIKVVWGIGVQDIIGEIRRLLRLEAFADYALIAIKQDLEDE